MLSRSLVFLSLLFTAPSALAAADLATSITAQSSPALTYQSVRYTVAVRNIGNKSASSASLAISLPATHTSPQVYVLGILGQRSAGCVLSGTTLTCALGTINKATTKSVFFDIALPVSTQPYVLSAAVTTSSAENSTANNAASYAVAETYYATPVNAAPGVPVAMRADHCTGTGLVSFYECSLFPSSLSWFDALYHDDGSVTIPGEPDFSGHWTLTSTPQGNVLELELSDLTGVVAEFSGWGASPNCFEGMTTFPGSTYVAPYHICAQ